MRRALFVVAALLACPPLAAGTLAGVELPDRVDVDGHSLVLNGMGLRTKLFIKVYVGGLYLPQKETSAAAILGGDAPRRMDLQFLYDVSQEQMCDAWKEGLEANTPGAPADVRQAFDDVCRLMDGVGKGQRLSLTYLPGEGTRVELGGTVKGTLPGRAVADALLSTWLGAKPGPGEGFKKGVLGQ